MDELEKTIEMVKNIIAHSPEEVVKHYDINTADDSIKAMYINATKQLEEQAGLIDASKYYLILDWESLDKEEDLYKYCEVNRRASGLALACEYYLKYMLLCTKDKNCSAQELWDKKNWDNNENGKGIRIHKLNELINMFDKSYPNFSNILKSIIICNDANSMKNSDNESRYNLAPFCDMRKVYPSPNTHEEYKGMLSTWKTEETIKSNSDSFVKGRYSIDVSNKNANIYELIDLIHLCNGLDIMAGICHDNVDNLDVDYKLGYVKHRLQEKDIHDSVNKIRTDEEIDELMNTDIIKDDAVLLYLSLVYDKYSVNEIKKMVQIDRPKEDLVFGMELGICTDTKTSGECSELVIDNDLIQVDSDIKENVNNDLNVEKSKVKVLK